MLICQKSQIPCREERKNYRKSRKYKGKPSKWWWRKEEAAVQSEPPQPKFQPSFHSRKPSKVKSVLRSQSQFITIYVWQRLRNGSINIQGSSKYPEGQTKAAVFSFSKRRGEKDKKGVPQQTGSKEQDQGKVSQIRRKQPKKASQVRAEHVGKKGSIGPGNVSKTDKSSHIGARRPSRASEQGTLRQSKRPRLFLYVIIFFYFLFFCLFEHSLRFLGVSSQQLIFESFLYRVIRHKYLCKVI